MASLSTHRSVAKNGRRWLIPLALVTGLATCHDESTGPGSEEEGGAEPPSGVTVSEPIALTVSSLQVLATRAAGTAGEVAYISAQPGTFPDADRITITNRTTGISELVTPVEGGFDPIALVALPGDELEIQVHFLDQETLVFRAEVPARRRPRVVRTLPPNGATDVVLSANVVVVFSEPVDEGSVTTGHLELRGDGGLVEGSLLVSEDRLRASFIPAEPLQEARTYTLTVRTGISDLQGDALEQEVQATFTTGSGLLAVSTGSYHTCALRADGIVICWGDNTGGQCGQPVSEIEPPQAVSTTLRFRSISAGLLNTCGIAVDGDAYCWGWNYFGQLGDGTTTDRDTPVLVSGGHDFVSLHLASHHTCGLTTDGSIYCWGRHDYLQLGPGEGDTCVHGGSDWPCSKTPMLVGGGFRSVTGGHLFACGLKTDGTAFCWGGDHVGQLGTDSDWRIETCSGYRCSRYPQAVSGGHTFRDLDAGAGHVCGITTEGTAYCWGKNDKGQMGAGFWSEPMDRHATPLPVVGGHIFASISGGDASTCALAPDGRAFCWGSNDFGVLGNGDPLGGIYAEPGPVSGAQAFLTLAAQGAHACALTAQGELYCWGWNKYGQLGRDPSSLEGEMSLVPVLVPLG